MKTKEIFCTNEQKVTEQVVTYVNEEYIFTCKCGRFFKLPGTLTKEQIDQALTAHEESNQDQVTQEALDKEAEEKLKLI